MWDVSLTWKKTRPRKIPWRCVPDQWVPVESSWTFRALDNACLVRRVPERCVQTLGRKQAVDYNNSYFEKPKLRSTQMARIKKCLAFGLYSPNLTYRIVT